MRVLVTGANGFIGSHVLRGLQAAGHEVVACVREPQRFRRHRTPDATAIAADFSRDHTVEDWLPRLSGMDAVVNCVGIIREQGRQTFDALHRDAPCALFQACAHGGVRHVVQISALGADHTAFSHYHRSKKAADDCLARLDLDWVIVQPSIVYGPGAASMALFKALAALPLVPVVGRGEQAVQPIHVQDLVRAVVRLLEPGAPARRYLPAVGPAPIPFRQLLTELRHWLELGEPRFLAVPYSVALAGAKLAGLLGNAPLNSDAVRMLQRGNTSDASALRSLAGVEPRPLQQALAETPAQTADLWHARLYFLLPLLRMTLALLWIVTGIISAFIYPRQQSYALLAQVGISGSLAPLALYGAATLDTVLGIALLMRRKTQWVGAAMIAIIAAYSAVIAIWLPEQWLHPFGPVTKNIPLVVATLMVMAVEARR